MKPHKVHKTVSLAYIGYARHQFACGRPTTGNYNTSWEWPKVTCKKCLKLRHK